MKSVENFDKLKDTLFIFYLLPRLFEHSFSVAKERGAWSAAELWIYADPLGLKLGLDHFKAV